MPFRKLTRRGFVGEVAGAGLAIAVGGRSTLAESRDDSVRVAIARMEAIVGEDIGGRRGIAPLVSEAAGGLLGAAQSLASHEKPIVGVITGFYTPYASPPSCETDGPPGAAHLAKAFRAAGISCRMATDVPNAPVISATLSGAGIPGDFPLDVVSVGVADGGRRLYDVIDEWRNAGLTHVVSVERAGPGPDGLPHNFRGYDISRWTAPLDRLFTGGEWVTIGIGDGGNELGMGNLPPKLIAEHVPRGAEVGCAIGCDHLMVCGVSNWGGWALPAAMALLNPRLAKPLTAGLDRKTDLAILRACVEDGRAAGSTSFEPGAKWHPVMYVDGLPWEVHARKLEELMNVFASV